ncbi:MAG: diguanylate cyclase [Actinomycetales bacterium]|nr:diguanylate cyclase [Actinomycetales bacterium]
MKTSARLVVAVMTGVESYQLPMVRGICTVLEEAGVPLLVHVGSPSSGRFGMSSLERILQRMEPRGVITTNALIGETERTLVEILGGTGVPTVHLGQEIPGAVCVRGENVTGMRALTNHVIDDCGAARIVLVRGLRHQPDAISRERAFREVLVERGMAVDEDLVVDGEFDHDVAYQALRWLLHRRRDLDAVVALNDGSALGAIEALTDAGLRVPEDVVVTGFDNDPSAALHWPGVTTVDQDLEGQGRAAAALLVDWLNGTPPPERTAVPSRVVLRRSTLRREGEEGRLLATATEMAKGAKSLLAKQAAVLDINRMMINCRTVEQVVGTLTNHVQRHLNVRRCFLAIYDGLGVPGRFADIRSDRARLVMDYRDGYPRTPPPELFPAHQLLPDELRYELDTGVLVFQSLASAGRDLGYVLFEQGTSEVGISEVLRMDLGRTLGVVVSTQELRDRATSLERLVAQRTAELARVNLELRRSLMVDPLTRIANRTAFDAHLEQHWEALAGTAGELAVLMVDVDLFKAFNDCYGHLLGDDALRTVATCLDGAVREPSDLACRYGGEEFAVVLPGRGVPAARAVAERFRRLLAEAAVPHAGSPVSSVVTTSIGIAAGRAEHGTDPASVVARADAALYRAKESGRDRVAVFTMADMASGHASL